MTEWNTTHVEKCLAGIRAGDAAARDELFAGCQQRLLKLVRKMLRTRFPDVRRWEETPDVFQEVCVRLDRALRSVPVTSAVDFLRLASVNIRRELIDLARHYGGPHGPGRHHATPNGVAGPPDPPDPASLASLDWWQAFHQAVEQLPEDQREVFCLIFYQGFTQGEVARLLGVSESTVKRRWTEAKVWLLDELGDDLPDEFGENG